MTRALAPAPALAIVLRALRTRPGAVVLVDGRSGSGKTTFAAAAARASGARLLRLDDVYPGWDGLDAAARALVDTVLGPRRHGVAGLVRGWDWAAGAARGVRCVPVDGPLVVEGCGALSRAASDLADLRVWLQLDDAERRRRALDRDGERYAPHWARWAGHERRFRAREAPRSQADLVVDGRRFPQRLFSESTVDAQYPRRP